MNKSITSSSLLLLFAVIGIFMIGFNYEDNKANAQRVYQTYENDIYGIKIKYPPNWEVSEYNMVAGETGEALVDIHPVKKSDPFVKSSVLFLSPENATLQSFTEQKLKDIQTPLFDFQTMKVLSQNSSVTLGGYPAQKVIYEITSSLNPGKPEVFKQMNMWTVLETEAYDLVFAAQDKKQYDQYIKTAENIINSFQFTR